MGQGDHVGTVINANGSPNRKQHCRIPPKKDDPREGSCGSCESCRMVFALQSVAALIAALVSIVAVGILMVGYVFNVIM
jgi:hypothetical protein